MILISLAPFLAFLSVTASAEQSLSLYEKCRDGVRSQVQTKLKDSLKLQGDAAISLERSTRYVAESLFRLESKTVYFPAIDGDVLQAKYHEGYNGYSRSYEWFNAFSLSRADFAQAHDRIFVSFGFRVGMDRFIGFAVSKISDTTKTYGSAIPPENTCELEAMYATRIVNEKGTPVQRSEVPIVDLRSEVMVRQRFLYEGKLIAVSHHGFPPLFADWTEDYYLKDPSYLDLMYLDGK